jgi:hypothetical protein
MVWNFKTYLKKILILSFNKKNTPYKENLKIFGFELEMIIMNFVKL